MGKCAEGPGLRGASPGDAATRARTRSLGHRRPEPQSALGAGGLWALWAPGGSRGRREPAAQDDERQVPVKLLRAWTPG